MGDAAESDVLVDPCEDVCRLCFSASIPISHGLKHPNQVDVDTQLIRLEELSWVDFKDRGFSLQRRKLYGLKKGLDEAARREAAKARKTGGDVSYKLSGVLIANVAVINAISNGDGKQVFRVLQTPTAAQPGHAEIRIAEGLQKHHLLKYRVHLQSALGTMQDASLLDVE